MTQEEIDVLTKHLSADKQFIHDGYYRLRELDERTYELAFLVADACGATSVHPQITIEKQGDTWQAVKLLDFVSTPVETIVYSQETAQELSERLEQLFKQALHAINQ